MSTRNRAKHSQLEISMARLNHAYQKNRLDNCKALRLANSFSEKTTCYVQWGPQMRT